MRTVLRSFVFVMMAGWLPLVGSAAAQPEPDTVGSLAGIEVMTAVDRAEILIGDLITYTLTITYDSTYDLIPPPLGANLGAFDVKDYRSDQISRLDDGRLRSTNEFVLSTFTTGDYVIPPIPVLFNLPDGRRKVLLSESVPIRVISLLEEGADSLDIRPQKAVYEFPRDYTRYYLIGGAVLILLMIAGYFLWRRLRRKEDGAEPVDLRPPWEIAFEKLAMLKEKHLPAEGRLGLHYLELTEIIRDYVGRMYQVEVMEMTTEEFLARFREVPLPGTLYQRFGEFFPHADLVKFARYVPEAGRAEADLDVAHNMVELVRSDFARHNAAIESGDRASDDHHRNPSVTEVGR